MTTTWLKILYLRAALCRCDAQVSVALLYRRPITRLLHIQSLPRLWRSGIVRRIP